MYSTIKYELRDAVALITLNRPESLNAWTSQMGIEVKHAIASSEDNPDVIGIVITGEGKAFCAGADMADLQALSSGGGTQGEKDTSLDANPGDERVLEQYQTGFSYLAAVRKPIIAAVNGAVAGMTLPLILYCDMRFFGEKGFVMSAFPVRGLVAEYGSSWILPRIVGVDKALDILYSSRKIYGEEALELGLATRVYDDESLVDESINYLQDLADRCAPESLRHIKGQVYRDLNRGPQEAIEESISMMLESFTRNDMKEGVAAFIEKRKPNFKRVGKE